MVIKNNILVIILIFIMIFSGCSLNNDYDKFRETKNHNENTILVLKEDGGKSELEIKQEKLAQIISDGTYIEEVTYNTPAGEDSFNLNLEIKDDKIVSLSLEFIRAHEKSRNYVNNVNSELQTLVVGKSLSEIKIPKVIAGASLTTKAFNLKLEEIKVLN